MSSDEKRAFFEDGRWLSRTFECDCGAYWTENWSCDCDDECPDCGASVSPSESEDMTAWAIEEWGMPPLGLADDVPEEIPGPRRGELSGAPPLDPTAQPVLHPDMDGKDLWEARGVLGAMWGLGRPVSMNEMGRALRLKGTGEFGKPGDRIRDFERGKNTITGPMSAAVDMMLQGALPPDGIPAPEED